MEDPSIWESHIKDNSEWAKFRKDGFPQYLDLCIVFGDTYATGEYAARNAEYLVVSEEEDNGVGGGDNGGDDNGGGGSNGGGAAVGDPEELSEYPNDEGVFSPDVTATPVHEKYKLDRNLNSKRKRMSNTYDVSGTFKAIQDIIKSRTGQSISGSVISHAPPPEDAYYLGAAVAVINGMPNLEQNFYNRAMNQACLNATWRADFIIFLPEMRCGLLESL